VLRSQACLRLFRLKSEAFQRFVCVVPHVLQNSSDSGPYQVFIWPKNLLPLKNENSESWLLFWWCLQTAGTDLQCITSSSLLPAVWGTDFSWDGSFGRVWSFQAHWGSDSSRWWNNHANSLLPAPPARHLQDWACQSVTGSRPCLLIRDQSWRASLHWLATDWQGAHRGIESDFWRCKSWKLLETAIFMKTCWSYWNHIWLNYFTFYW